MPHVPDARPRWLMPRRLALVFQVCALGVITSTAGAPTPLYPIYQDHLALSPFMVTMIFAVYSFSLLVALLTVGALSDHVGRKPVMFAALVINIVAMAGFVIPPSFATLIAARVLQGIAVGIAMSTVGAAILDNDRGHGSLANSLTPVTGTATGAWVAAVLVTYAPMPAQLIYIVLMVMMTVLAVLMWWMPETAAARPGAWASLRPTIVVPADARRALVLITPGIVAVWAICGFYLALMPAVMRGVTGSTSPLLGGVVVSVLTYSGALAMLIARSWPAMTILIASMSCLIFGTLVTLLGVGMQSVALLMAGTAVAGMGFGAGFFGSIRTVVPLARAHERAGLLAVIFIVCYFAFSLPTVGAGLAIPVLGLPLTLDIYGVGVIVLAATSLVATVVSLRRTT